MPKSKDQSETVGVFTLIISEIASQEMKISSIPETLDKFDCRYSILNKNGRRATW